ncbi:hypothetical protein ACFWV1_26310 [Streptomyces sp. NPDC058700]|uniref:hypothetical protein n=1 Tax=Streptomyces sp. NPDC058700 TaxID=3346607 RepID=UPI00366451D8
MTIRYGTWTNLVNTYSTGPDADVLAQIDGGDPEWRALLETTGALDDIKLEYRRAIDAALPPGIGLSGDEILGSWLPEEGEFDGYPTDEHGDLDFAAMVEDIDLGSIVDRNEPLTLEGIGRDEMQSKAKEPAKAASKAMSRLGVKPAYGYHPNPDSGRPQALYRAGDVRKALASRPGQGTRTDKAVE